MFTVKQAERIHQVLYGEETVLDTEDSSEYTA
jgi:hypothetical protein